MHSLTDLLHQISTGPISRFREMRRPAKRVLNPVLPEDPGVILTSPPKVAVIKGQKKTNSTKRDKSYWEHVSIAHQKIQKSSTSVSGSGSGTGSGSLPGSGSGLGSRGRGRLPRAPKERGRGRDRGRSSLSAVIHASPCSTFPYTNALPAFIYPFIGNWKNVIGDVNCSYLVVAYFLFGDEHQWPEVRVNELVHRIHLLIYGPPSYAHWFKTPDSLYTIANAFNLCVILIAQLGSTTLLPLHSYLDRPEGTLVISLLIEQ
ncbi:hypothetical protein M9H77_26786 [Catharanthus roseus]|uniref:Uncharacterized protein n=1 Tax=Catharanthus roseus TaxID=4058 RepID=A0ACC0ADD4_CATRO|nr:hypothetical protein M9H77_26786 [Catharanthus roseus]